MSRWFRWYEGTTEDGKFRVVARNAGVTLRDVIALWAFMLEDASRDEHRGRCTRDIEYMSAILDLDAPVGGKIIAEMARVGLVSDTGNGGLSINNWQKRQFENDKKDGTAAERQRRYRERHRNDRVTAPSQPDTDTDTEKEEAALRSAVSSDVSRETGKTAKRGCRIPDDFEPDTDEAVALGLPLAEAIAEVAKFKDHWKAKAGRDGVKLDWPATWRNWCRRAAEYRTTDGRAAPTTTPSTRPTVWIEADDPAFKSACALYERKTGRKAFAAGSRAGNAGIGFAFPVDCTPIPKEQAA